MWCAVPSYTSPIFSHTLTGPEFPSAGSDWCWLWGGDSSLRAWSPDWAMWESRRWKSTYTKGRRGKNWWNRMWEDSSAQQKMWKKWETSAEHSARVRRKTAAALGHPWLLTPWCSWGCWERSAFSAMLLHGTNEIITVCVTYKLTINTVRLLICRSRQFDIIILLPFPAESVQASKKNKRRNRKRRKDVAMPPEIAAEPELAKYWAQRYRLFSRFDEGIKLDHGESAQSHHLHFRQLIHSLHLFN